MGWLQYETCVPTVKTGSRYELFEEVLNTYNNATGIKGTNKTFRVGYVKSESTKSITLEIGYDDDYLSILRKIAGSNMFVRVRRENGERYIDLVRFDDFGTENEQFIQLGENLLDYTKELNTSWMCNVVYPYGAETEIELFEGAYERIKGDAVANNESIAKYGRIAKNIIWDGAKDKETLKANAELYLAQNAQPRMSLELNALDMSEFGISTSKLDLGDLIRVIALPFGVDQWIRVKEMSIDLQDVSKNNYKLSSTVTAKNDLTTVMAQELELIPTKSEILDAAKKNALSMLNGTNGGYLSFIFNEDRQMTGFQITDTKDPTQASKKWVWNENGLGFMYKYGGVWHTNNAMTADGQIVADRITTGTLNGDLVNVINVKASSVDAEDITGTTITGKKIKGGSIDGATFTQSGIHGTVDISDGWLTARSNIDAGSAFVLYGHDSETLYGSKYMHFSSSTVFLQATTEAVLSKAQDSDKRLKDNIEEIESDTSKHLINKIKPCSFNYKNEPDRLRFGVIAQDVLPVLEECNYDTDNMALVRMFSTGTYGVTYEEFIPHIINCVNDLYSQIDELKAEINTLKGDNQGQI